MILALRDDAAEAEAPGTDVALDDVDDPDDGDSTDERTGPDEYSETGARS